MHSKPVPSLAEINDRRKQAENNEDEALANLRAWDSKEGKALAEHNDLASYNASSQES